MPSISIDTIAMISVVARWNSEMRIFAGVGINNNRAWLVPIAVTPTDARVFPNTSPPTIFPFQIINTNIVNKIRDERMPMYAKYL